MKLLLKIFCLIILISFFCPIYSQEDYNDNISQEEWEAWHDEYAKRVIILMSGKEKLEAQIDSLKKVSSSIDALNCEEKLYALVGTTKEVVGEFRKKFDETEKKINGKVGTPSDVSKYYYDEISVSKIICLPEFNERFLSMKKIMTGIIITSENKTDMTSYEVKPGDNLRKISKKILGSEKDWKIIYDANKKGVINKDKLPKEHQTITNPNKIYPGQVLQVPKKNI